MNKTSNTLADLRNRYLAGEIDTEQYLVQVDAIHHEQQQKTKKSVIPAGVAVTGGGVASIFSPEIAFVLILLVVFVGVLFFMASRLSK